MEPLLLYVGAAAAAALLGLVLVFLARGKGKGEGSTAGSPQSSRDEPESKAADYPGGKMSVYFGSQTGTAEGFAQEIVEEARKKGFDAQVVDLEDFEPSEVKDCRLAVFLMSTYGEGEPTDNAASFMKWLKNPDGELDNALAGMNYTVFGLGNRQYEHFNRMGKVVDADLEKIGGQRFFTLGLGDDDASIEDDFEQWKDEMINQLVAQFHPSAGDGGGKEDASEVAIPEIPLRVVEIRSKGKVAPAKLSTDHVQSSTRHYFTAATATVAVNRELRSAKDPGSTRHMELDLTGAKVPYHTADNLAVLPENDDASVQRLAAHMGYDLDQAIKLEGVGPSFKHPFPSPTTVGHALKLYCDIHGIPRRSTVVHFVPFATDPSERSALAELTAKEGRHRFKSLVEDGKRSLLDILTEDFPSMRVPLAHFLVLCPRQQPRYYTIASSSSLHPTSIHLTVSVITEGKPNGGVHRGVCSTFLQRLEVPTGRSPQLPQCQVFVRDSSFRLPSDAATPIILIGPGTGIAPMRALLQERSFQKSRGLPVGETMLYFGCKTRDQDFLYQEELEQFQAEGVLTSLEVAFSREGKAKVYVQHLMQRDADSSRMWDMIDGQGAHVYVCGGTAMGTDVGKVLLETVVMKKGGRSTADAEKYISDLKAAGRYVQELWA